MDNISQHTMEDVLNFVCISPDCQDKERRLSRKQPQLSILNGLDTSLIVYPHELGLTCRYCNTYYQIAIADGGARIEWTLVPVSRPKESNIIVPPLNLIKQ